MTKLFYRVRSDATVQWPTQNLGLAQQYRRFRSFAFLPCGLFLVLGIGFGCSLGPLPGDCRTQSDCVGGKICRARRCVDPAGLQNEPSKGLQVYFGGGNGISRYQEGVIEEVALGVGAAFVGRGPNNNELYMSTESLLHRVVLFPLSSTNVGTIRFGQGVGLSDDYIFWGEAEDGIKRGRRDQPSDVEAIVDLQGMAPNRVGVGLVVDNVRDRVYFVTDHTTADCTDSGKRGGLCHRHILAADFDGQNLSTIRTLENASCLAIDVDTQELFFSDLVADADGHAIWRLNLGNQAAQVLFTVSDLSRVWCTGLFVDRKNQVAFMVRTDEGANSALLFRSFDGPWAVLHEWPHAAGGVLAFVPDAFEPPSLLGLSLSGLYYSRDAGIYRYDPEAKRADGDPQVVATDGPAYMATGGSPDDLYYTTSSLLARVSLGSQETTLIGSTSGGLGLARSQEAFYWPEGIGGLKRADLELMEPATNLINLNEMGAADRTGPGIAYDSVEEQVYFLSRRPDGDCEKNASTLAECGHLIWRMNQDGSHLMPLRGLGDAGCLALDVQARHLYFSDRLHGKGPHQIWRMNIDGSKPERLFDVSGNEAYRCSALALDPQQGVLFLLRSHRDSFSSLLAVRLDGLDRFILREWDGGAGGLSVQF